MAVYDATNPEARAYYWNLMDKALFQIGADAWWLDTTEPETEGREENLMLNNKLAIGSGARYANIFPLMTTTAVYDGQRKASDRKRVFILSRSAFAGAQRNAVTAWSGDILSDFETYKRQIPAGLNFSLSGIPYWTTDIGGFFIGNPNDPAYRELFVRWFQYGTFCPIFRVHGTRTTNQNELWSYGPEAQSILTKFDRLRYELMPYIYSVAWMTTHASYTPMRPLVMDFRADVRAQNIGDQFLFGPAILVNPVTEPGATTRHLYLPKAKWYDFWSGHAADGGRSIDAPATLDRLPLYVRAGSIVPMGPDVEYAAEKPADPIELRVYSRRRRQLHALRRRERQLRLRKGCVRYHPHPLGRCRPQPDHRRAQRTVPRHAGVPHLPRRFRRRRPRRGNRSDRPAGQSRAIFRPTCQSHSVGRLLTRRAAPP